MSTAHHRAQWQRKRREVIVRDGLVCAKCGGVGLEYEVHHTAALKDGGTDEGPLQVLCRACHVDHHHPVSAESKEWRDRISGMVQRLRQPGERRGKPYMGGHDVYNV